LTFVKWLLLKRRYIYIYSKRYIKVKTVKLKSEVLRWVRERGGLEIVALAQKMKVSAEEVRKWEATGEIRLSMTKKLASYTRTPLGYLFLEEPLSDKLPIPDFRTVSDEQVQRPSPDLLEMVQTMQRRQRWMREFLIEEGVGKLSFVGSASMNLKPEKIAAMIRESLGITEDWARKLPTWTDALRRLREIIDAAGILIFINGIIANNTHRKLDPEEFRGFVLCDEYAPLIFINGADARAAQMFTIAHELAHIWLGKEGVSNFDVMLPEAQ
jgi:transcriptional regulator with XRE-family HTH domain